MVMRRVLCHVAIIVANLLEAEPIIIMTMTTIVAPFRNMGAGVRMVRHVAVTSVAHLLEGEAITSSNTIILTLSFIHLARLMWKASTAVHDPNTYAAMAATPRATRLVAMTNCCTHHLLGRTTKICRHYRFEKGRATMAFPRKENGGTMMMMASIAWISEPCMMLMKNILWGMKRHRVRRISAGDSTEGAMMATPEEEPGITASIAGRRIEMSTADNPARQ
mmetsp:Transcript_43658/g.91842  ORF Transcript_43658/g.91842 Transcript_43658/m.91842 type:complete len:221 (-) Transcript_43658:1982-2644(-)